MWVEGWRVEGESVFAVLSNHLLSSVEARCSVVACKQPNQVCFVFMLPLDSFLD